MPRFIFYLLLVAVAVTLIPVSLVYRSMNVQKGKPRIQVVYDMDDQVHVKTQTVSDFFPDGQSMRKQPEGTVARGMLHADDAFYLGYASVADSIFATTFPVKVDDQLMERGRNRFAIYCAPCHGQSGNGLGLVHLRAAALAEGTWTPPTDLTGPTVIERPVGHIYNTIKNGIRNMPAYGSQVGPMDRWAITAYVRALQLSRNAKLEDLPAEAREKLQK